MARGRTEEEAVTMDGFLTWNTGHVNISSILVMQLYFENIFKHNIQYGAMNSIFKASVLLRENLKVYRCYAENSCVHFSENFAQITTTDVSYFIVASRLSFQTESKKGF